MHRPGWAPSARQARLPMEEGMDSTTVTPPPVAKISGDVQKICTDEQPHHDARYRRKGNFTQNVKEQTVLNSLQPLEGYGQLEKKSTTKMDFLRTDPWSELFREAGTQQGTNPCP